MQCIVQSIVYSVDSAMHNTVDSAMHTALYSFQVTYEQVGDSGHYKAQSPHLQQK